MITATRLRAFGIRGCSPIDGWFRLHLHVEERESAVFSALTIPDGSAFLSIVQMSEFFCRQ